MEQRIESASISRPSRSRRCLTWYLQAVGRRGPLALRPPGLRRRRHRTSLVDDPKAGAIEGGSTITQQLAKNQYFTQEQTVERKVAEVFMARPWSRRFTKRGDTELYVNPSTSRRALRGHRQMPASAGKELGRADGGECTPWPASQRAERLRASENPDLAQRGSARCRRSSWPTIISTKPMPAASAHRRRRRAPGAPRPPPRPLLQPRLLPPARGAGGKTMRRQCRGGKL